VAHLVPAAFASTLFFAPSEAVAAEPATRKVLAVHVEGQSAADAREDILAVLPDRITVVDKGDVTAAMRKFGLSKPLGSAMTQAKSRKGYMLRLKKAAKEVDADGFIVGIVQRYSGKWRVYVVWLGPDGDELLVDEPVSREGSEQERRSALERALSGAIEQFSPKPATTSTGDSSTPTPKDPQQDEPDDKPARVRHEAGSSIFAVEVGMEGVGRRFDFTDGATPNLRAYELFGAPVVFAGAEVYPAGWTTVPVLRDIGLTIGYARAFALQSATTKGTPFDTVHQRFSAGLRYRIPISRPTGPVLGLSGQYYLHTFQIDEPPELAGQTPSVDYRAIRAGIDGRFPVGRAAIVAGFDWIEPLSTGPVYDRFTRAKVHGFDGKLGLFVRIASGFELRFSAEYARFFSDFAPAPGDTYVASGAVDQYLGIRLAGAYVE